MAIRFIFVDFQKDFSAKGGPHYRLRPSVKFIKGILLPFLNRKKIKVAEIISDYRQPRKNGRTECCVPGQWGYESEIPKQNKNSDIWIKSANAPSWVRKNAGDPKRQAGEPYPNTARFDKWLSKNIGKPEKTEFVVLMGLTLDCCVLCTAQELKFRGYKVKILKEATDTYNGTKKEKDMIISNFPLINWAREISWKELKQLL